MSKDERKIKNYQMVKRVLLLQALLVVVLSAIWYFESPQASYSALAGGGIWLLASAYFMYAVFKHQGASQAKKIIRNFYIGEVLKLLIVGVLVVVGVSQFHLILLPVMTGLIVGQLANWFMPWMTVA